MTMESVDLSDANMAQSIINDTNDKGPVSLEQIQIEASEERCGDEDNYDNTSVRSSAAFSPEGLWLMTQREWIMKQQELSGTCENYHSAFH